MLEEGEIIVAGTDLTKLSRKELGEYRRKKIGVVFQAYNLIAELNVRENIRVVQDISEAPLSMDELLEDLGIARHAGSFPSELSSGQQQQCAIGRALIKNPEILLCDEPTGALERCSWPAFQLPVCKGVLWVLFHGCGVSGLCCKASVEADAGCVSDSHCSLWGGVLPRIVQSVKLRHCS